MRIEIKVVLDRSWHQLVVISLQGGSCCDETTALHSGFVEYAPHFLGASNRSELSCGVVLHDSSQLR